MWIDKDMVVVVVEDMDINVVVNHHSPYNPEWLTGLKPPANLITNLFVH